MAPSAAAATPLNPTRPFTRAQALRHGMSIRTLTSPGYHKVLHGVYVAATVPVNHVVRAQAALLVSPPGSWISHGSAARLWEGVVPDDSDLHVTTPTPAGRSVRRGVKAHAASPGIVPVRHRGLPVSSPVQTFLDLAGSLDLLALVVLGDSLLRACRLPAAALVDATSSCRGNGVKAARRAAHYVREGVDSAKESQLRMLIVLAGLPEPTVNFILRHPDGSWRRRFDLCYPQLKLIIEYDGKDHGGDLARWRSDLRRREELDRMGWRIIVVTHEDLRDDSAGVLARVREALEERGATGLGRRPRTEWMRYFAA